MTVYLCNWCDVDGEYHTTEHENVAAARAYDAELSEDTWELFEQDEVASYYSADRGHWAISCLGDTAEQAEARCTEARSWWRV